METSLDVNEKISDSWLQFPEHTIYSISNENHECGSYTLWVLTEMLLYQDWLGETLSSESAWWAIIEGDVDNPQYLEMYVGTYYYNQVEHFIYIFWKSLEKATYYYISSYYRTFLQLQTLAPFSTCTKVI